MAKAKNVSDMTAAGGDELPASAFSEAELEAILGAFRERGGFMTSPELFVTRVLTEPEGRTESVLPFDELTEGFEDAGFVTVKRTADYVIMANKLADGVIRVVKVFNGSKRRIRWKTVRK